MIEYTENLNSYMDSLERVKDETRLQHLYGQIIPASFVCLGEKQGCCVIPKSIEESLNVEDRIFNIKEHYFDFTEFEASCNEFYFSDYELGADITLQSLSNLGVSMIYFLSEKLITTYPNHKFTFYGVLDIEYTSFSIFFHTFHEGEESWTSIEGNTSHLLIYKP